MAVPAPLRSGRLLGMGPARFLDRLGLGALDEAGIGEAAEAERFGEDDW